MGIVSSEHQWYEDDDESAQYLPYCPGGSGNFAGNEIIVGKAGSVVRRSDDLRALLCALEVQLSNPVDHVEVGAAYQRLYEWTVERGKDPDLGRVLDRLEPEGMYPEWRRKALEEAYVLFYEDIVKAGNTKSVEELPPPPLSRGQQQHGGEQVDDGLTLRNRTFETGSRFWKVDRWEYEIRDAGPKAAIMPSSETVPARERDPNESRESMSRGREIASKQQTARYCACATDPFCNMVAGLDLDMEPAQARSYRFEHDDPSGGLGEVAKVVSREPRLYAVSVSKDGE